MNQNTVKKSTSKKDKIEISDNDDLTKSINNEKT